MIPEKGDIGLPIDAKTVHAPSKLGPITFGKWWYWKDYTAHSYTIDDVRLEPSVAPDAKTYRPTGAPLARVLAKLKAHKPITVVMMGGTTLRQNLVVLPRWATSTPFFRPSPWWIGQV